MQGNDADGPRARDTIDRRELIVDLDGPAVLVPRDRPVPRGVGDELPSCAGHDSTGNVSNRLEDRFLTGPQLTEVRPVELTGLHIEPRVDGRDGLDATAWARPSSFASRRRGDTDEPSQSLDHPLLPQPQVASQVAALSNQPIGISHVLDS